MPWALITTVANFIFKILGNEMKNDEISKKELDKLAANLDSLSQKHAKLNFQYQTIVEKMKAVELVRKESKQK